MANTNAPAAAAVCDFFEEDTVRVVSPSSGKNGEIAIVLRTWLDERAPTIPEETVLADNTVEVVFPLDETRAEVHETHLVLLDRGRLVTGDVVRYTGPSTSPRKKVGVVLSTSGEVRLQRVLSGLDVPGWHASAKLVAASRLGRGDYVTTAGWIGLVEDVYEAGLVKIRSSRRMPPFGTLSLALRPGEEKSHLVLAADVGRRLPIGSAGQAFDRPEGGPGQLLGPEDDHMIPPGQAETVYDSAQLVVAVNWLCFSQFPSTSASPVAPSRPMRYWTALDQLSLVRCAADLIFGAGERMRFRPAFAAEYPLPEELQQDAFKESHHVMQVIESRTEVQVLWQDGSRTTQKAVELMPAVDLDEDSDVFPGDSGVALDRPCVVQEVDSTRRVLKVRFRAKDGGAGGNLFEDTVEVISSLEYDPHGPPPALFGVRRGDRVLLAPEGSTNGNEWPVVPSLGESETLTGALDPESIANQLLTVGGTLSSGFRDPGGSRPGGTFDVKYVNDHDSSIRWIGLVEDLRTEDGAAKIVFPDGEAEWVQLDRIWLLDDGLETEMFGGQPGEPHEHGMEIDDGASGSWRTESDNGEEGENAMNGWSDDEEGDDDDDEDDGVHEIELDDEEEDEPESAGVGAFPVDVAAPAPPKESEGEVPKAPETSVDTSLSKNDTRWRKFTSLEEAPIDHHFVSNAQGPPAKAFLSRIGRELKVLDSSLPDGILVRTYEDRVDLLRALIIGPKGTPFEDAPFLFDISCEPSSFPTSPPLMFFHSWVKSARVSPNLYVEGKTCLSLLGTWAGDRSESWSPTRSSLLQLLVSVQSLVLVDEPFYTEPGFEKRKDTPEGEAASALYSERTFSLSRAYILHALQYPPASFEEEIKTFYLDKAIGRLPAVVDQVEKAIAESEAAQAAASGAATAPEPSAVLLGLNVLTEGAVITLRRTLKGLKDILAASL